MNKSAIESFLSLAPLEMPDLIDVARLESSDDYDDYVLLSFSMPVPMSIDEVLDCLEDQTELNILYHVKTVAAGLESQHCCAYASPEYENMYKVNVQTNSSDEADTVYVYIYSSLEVMLEALKDDLRLHDGMGESVFKMPLSRLIADFM